MSDYLDYASCSPMSDGKEIRSFLDTIYVPLCDHCIARAKANKDYISVGRITKAKKCYYCDDTDIPLYRCRVEP